MSAAKWWMECGGDVTCSSNLHIVFDLAGVVIGKK